MTFSVFSPWKGPSGEGEWTKMVFISFGLHLLVLILFLNIFPRGIIKKKLEPAYMVNLVSSPGGEVPGIKPKEPIAAPAPPPPRVEPKPIVLPKPVPDKIPLVTENRSKALEQAMEQLKKKVQQEKSLEKTLSRLEDKANDQQRLEKALARIESKKQSSLPAGQGTGVGQPGTISSSTPGIPDGVGIQFQLYHASVRSRIKRNWVLPEGLLKKSDISAEIMIRISRNGRIEDSRFERKSGLEAFDQEVTRTIKKSDPLPALPEGYPRSSYEIILTFHSKDLSGN
ncbi:MAG: cell envelope integrity protein TolA [Pseudomonadota bacterium]